MLDLQPDDKVSIGQKLNSMVNNQAAVGDVNTLSGKDMKPTEVKSNNLVKATVGVAIFFILLCLFIIVFAWYKNSIV